MFKHLKGNNHINGEHEKHIMVILFDDNIGLDTLLKLSKSTLKKLLPIYDSLKDKLSFTKIFRDEVFERPSVKSRIVFKHLYRINLSFPPGIMLMIANELERLDFVQYVSISTLPRLIDNEKSYNVTASDAAREERRIGTDADIVDFRPYQNYLKSREAWPCGLNVTPAWNFDDGEKCTVRHMDDGLVIDHDCFVDSDLENMPTDHDFHNGLGYHGTASTSIICGYNEQRGMRGISYNSPTKFYHFDLTDFYMWLESNAGEVMSVEVGYLIIFQGEEYLVPVTNNKNVWAMCKACVDDGVIVLVVGGNGGNDVRNHLVYTDHGDCGAIFTCALDSDGQMSYFSNHNFYHSLCAAGNTNVFAAGYGSFLTVSEPTKTWTATFGGTSGAHPQIVGCCALLNSYHYKVTGGRYMTCMECFDLLTKTGHIYDKRVGALPNMYAALKTIDDGNSGSGGNKGTYIIKTKAELNILNNQKNTLLKDLSDDYDDFEIYILENMTSNIFLNYAQENTTVEINIHASNANIYVYGTNNFNPLVQMSTHGVKSANFIFQNGKFIRV